MTLRASASPRQLASLVDGRAARDQHVHMGGEDEYDDEPMLSDEDLTTVEKDLFAAIREAHNLDSEIDDEYRKLASGEYNEAGPTEDPERGPAE